MKSKIFVCCFTVSALIFLWALTGCKSKQEAKPPNEPRYFNSLHTGVVAFDKEARIYKLSDNRKEAKRFIQRQANNVDSTALCYAVSEAVTLFKDDPVLPAFDHKFIVTFTDGDDNYSTATKLYEGVAYGKEYDRAGDDLRKSGVEAAYLIGYGDHMTRRNEFEHKLVYGSGVYVPLATTNELNKGFKRIYRKVMTAVKDYSLITNPGNFTPQTPKYFRITVTPVPSPEDGDLKPEEVICKLTDKTRLSWQKQNPYIYFDISQSICADSGGRLQIPLKKLEYWRNGNKLDDIEIADDLKVEISASPNTGYRIDKEDTTRMSPSQRKVAVVIVLDCTTSLGSAFETMKNAAIGFIEDLEKNLKK